MEAEEAFLEDLVMAFVFWAGSATFFSGLVVFAATAAYLLVF